MAAVSISVGGIQIDLGDEDRSAKYLTKLATKTIHGLVEFVDEHAIEPAEEEGDSDG